MFVGATSLLFDYKIEDKVKEGKIEVFDSFPEKYNDIFIQQANI